MWSGDRPGRGGWREKLGRPSNFWLNEWVGSNAERRTEAKKQVGEQSVGSVWGVKAEGLQDWQVLWGPGMDIRAVGLPSHSYDEPVA